MGVIYVIFLFLTRPRETFYLLSRIQITTFFVKNYDVSADRSQSGVGVRDLTRCFELISCENTNIPNIKRWRNVSKFVPYNLFWSLQFYGYNLFGYAVG